MSNSFHDLLLHLERQVYDPEVRASAELCAPLFAEDFVEFGGNGKVFDKAGIVEALVASPVMPGKPLIGDFNLKTLAEDLVLATYRLRLVDESGATLRASLRSTIYRRDGGIWVQVFHQATPV